MNGPSPSRRFILGRTRLGALTLTFVMIPSLAFAVTFTAIDVPGATATAAVGINDGGQIVGAFGDAGVQHGFLLDKGTFTTIDVPGATLTNARGINAGGQIVGTFFDAGGQHGFLAK
jgi:uncharacterized membrane protein